MIRSLRACWRLSSHPAALSRRGLLAAACAIACGSWATPASAVTESSYAARRGFNFAVIGDTPAGSRDEGTVVNVLAQIGREADLIVHVGNLKYDTERCDDATYQRRRALFDASPVPFVFAPGSNDWATCDRDLAGQFGPVERLNRLRELFFESSESMGTIKVGLQRLSDTARYRSYPENARWEYGDVLFVTLNMPGTHNNYRTGAGRNGEYEERILANAFWLRQAFSTATRDKRKAIVIAFDADPHFDGQQDLAASDGRDPFAEFKITLARLAAKFAGDVLIVHGAAPGVGTPPKPDHPLKVNGKPLENVMRIRAYGVGSAAFWIKVEVEPGRKGQIRVGNRNAVAEPPRP
ncbi:hypothetical protein GCM10007242_15480 [Pigmentiphaga litoralis]|uniref:metallophosphoesterase n=1 Tax=Pigmentiphaga litoralis TaxID=516702 RepID=UPI0016733E36|nr:metallophosphoesterase [Pigmentiphaga litoralis]GGX10366.1 hypothetical protein GCM10007242_15480 [Pigmentiphaga litoralis]